MKILSYLNMCLFFLFTLQYFKLYNWKSCQITSHTYFYTVTRDKICYYLLSSTWRSKLTSYRKIRRCLIKKQTMN